MSARLCSAAMSLWSRLPAWLRRLLKIGFISGFSLCALFVVARLIHGPGMREAIMRQIMFMRQDENLSGDDLKGADLEGKAFGASKLEDTDLRGAKLESATFIEADLRGALLDGADLTGANLIASKLENASLQGTKLDQAWLTDSNLTNANLAGATLNGARVAGADMSTSKGLTQAQLDTACGDASTRLPPGLTVPVCP
jgi:uncharacterized protein YjbI with pentapeptide repeats